MLYFYDVDPDYAAYLRQFDHRFPHIIYDNNRKFVCGVALAVNDCNYFAPISSNTKNQKTCILISDTLGNILSSIKFNFMFPVPNSVLTKKDFEKIRESDSAYADLLIKELAFCRSFEFEITNKAKSVYRIGCNPKHFLHDHCCDFKLLKTKHDEWIENHK